MVSSKVGENIEKLFKGDKDKISRFYNVCYSEFAKYGYDKTSTSGIAKKTQISKGLIFHYFDTKEKLYIHLLEKAYDEIESMLSVDDVLSVDDIIERFVILSKRKLELSYKMPYLFDFIISAFRQDDESIKQFLNDRQNNALYTTQVKIIQNYNSNLFKNDINEQYAINIIMLSINGFANNIMDLIKSQQDIDKNIMLDDIESLLNQLRTLFYN